MLLNKVLSFWIVLNTYEEKIVYYLTRFWFPGVAPTGRQLQLEASFDAKRKTDYECACRCLEVRLYYSHIFTDLSNFKLKQSNFNWLYIYRFAELNEEDALGLACGVEEVQNGVLREDFITRFEKVAGKKNTKFTWFGIVSIGIGAPRRGDAGHLMYPLIKKKCNKTRLTTHQYPLKRIC